MVRTVCAVAHAARSHRQDQPRRGRAAAQSRGARRAAAQGAEAVPTSPKSSRRSRKTKFPSGARSSATRTSSHSRPNRDQNNVGGSTTCGAGFISVASSSRGCRGLATGMASSRLAGRFQKILERRHVVDRGVEPELVILGVDDDRHAVVHVPDRFGGFGDDDRARFDDLIAAVPAVPQPGEAEVRIVGAMKPPFLLARFQRLPFGTQPSAGIRQRRFLTARGTRP